MARPSRQMAAAATRAAAVMAALATAMLLCGGVLLGGISGAPPSLGGAQGAFSALLSSKAHANHVKHRASRKVGNKYQEELAQVAKGADNDRADEMKAIDALQARSEGGSVESAKGGKAVKGSPKHPWEAEMQNLAHSKDDGLGALAKQHGIMSSKNYMAEIMALRHYKKNNAEINDIANGFEAHSSLSHKVRSSIDRAKARKQSKQSSVSKRGAASALLLEAGRVSRGHMLREAERRAETNIGHALTRTFKPIQHVLAGNEKTLDRMVRDRHRLQAATDQARRLEAELRRGMQKEVAAVVDAAVTAQEHQTHTYIAKVHAKVQDALTKVVDPDTVAYTPPSAAARTVPTQAWTGGAGSDWTGKVQKFLDQTEKYMKTHIESAAGEAAQVLAPPSVAPAAHKVGEQTVISATQHQLERELDSAQRAERGRKEGARGRLSAKKLGRS